MAEVTDKPIVLTIQQQAAYELLMRFALGNSDYDMALLEGYAGTGKTTLTAQLVGALADQLRIGIAAPTNKAVQVLKETIEQQTELSICQNREWNPSLGRFNRHSVEFGSIHSFLGLRLMENDDGSHQTYRRTSQSILHDYDLIIVDECSMLDTGLLNLLFDRKIKRQTRVLFVGDPAQLPPVGNQGRPSLIFERITIRAMLSEIVRQAADNPIIQLSAAIRLHMERDIAISKETILALLPSESGNALCNAALPDYDPRRDYFVEWATHDIQAGNDTRIIAYTNQAVDDYNRRIHENLYGITRSRFVEGERVIFQTGFEVQAAGLHRKIRFITSEECIVDAVIGHELNPLFREAPATQLLLKTDDGILAEVSVTENPNLLRQKTSDLFAEAKQKNADSDNFRQLGAHSMAYHSKREATELSNYAWMLRKTFAPLRHTYAMTTHKSQGSTYDTAIVDYNNLSKMRSPFEFNRALYVAATRAREHLAIVV